MTVSDVDGSLKTTGWFDYERHSNVEYNISCEISEGNSTETFHSVLQVFITDVDDNAPYVQENSKLIHELDITQVIPVNIVFVELHSFKSVFLNRRYMASKYFERVPP